MVGIVVVVGGRGGGVVVVGGGAVDGEAEEEGWKRVNYIVYDGFLEE